MNMTRSCIFSLRTTALAMLAFACAALAPGAALQQYTVRNLGTQLGHTASAASALNDKGEVVGYTRTAAQDIYRGFFIEPPYIAMISTGTYKGDPVVFARDINAHGVVVGNTESPSPGLKDTMIVWRQGALSIVPHLSGEDSSYLTGINDLGAMVGASGDKGMVFSGGNQTELVPLPTYTSALPTGVNSAGVVAGMSIKGFLETRATKWVSGVATAVPDLGGSYSQANAIAENGLIVGRSRIPDNSAYHAFMTPSGGSATDLGVLSGGSTSEAKGTNGTVVVGQANIDTMGFRAFVYSGGAMQDLNDLIPAGSGWLLTDATDVNANGQICGWGSFEGQSRAYLLTPNPPTGGAADWDFNIDQNGWTAVTNVPPFEPAEAQWLLGFGYAVRATGYPCFAFLQSPEVTLRNGHTYRLYVTISTTATAIDAAPQIRLRAYHTSTNMTELLALDSVGDALPSDSEGARVYQFTITPQITGPAQQFLFYLDYTFFNPFDEQDAWVYLESILLVEM